MGRFGRCGLDRDDVDDENHQVKRMSVLQLRDVGHEQNHQSVMLFDIAG